ncbi:MAG TPA: hypothetical protein VD713_03205, partial [Sphingomonadales bacterium]|nr:hypothetical protein [Sphingomonadales bacterium]
MSYLRRGPGLFAGTVLWAAAASVIAFWPGPSRPVTTAGPPAASPRALERFAALPVRFEENRGQTDASVRFLARGAGYTLFLTGQEAVLSLRGNKGAETAANQASGQSQVLLMRPAGSKSPRAVRGEQVSEARSNYFIGRDASRWHADVPQYRRVR